MISLSIEPPQLFGFVLLKNLGRWTKTQQTWIEREREVTGTKTIKKENEWDPNRSSKIEHILCPLILSFKKKTKNGFFGLNENVYLAKI